MDENEISQQVLEQNDSQQVLVENPQFGGEMIEQNTNDQSMNQDENETLEMDVSFADEMQQITDFSAEDIKPSLDQLSQTCFSDLDLPQSRVLLERIEIKTDQMSDVEENETGDPLLSEEGGPAGTVIVKPPAKKYPSAKHCSVVGCHNNYKKKDTPDVRFFKFPQCLRQRNRWLNLIKRFEKDGSPWSPRKTSGICSNHFLGGKPSSKANHPDYFPRKFPELHKENMLKRIQTAKEIIAKNKMLQHRKDVNDSENYRSVQAPTPSIHLGTDKDPWAFKDLLQRQPKQGEESRQRALCAVPGCKGVFYYNTSSTKAFHFPRKNNQHQAKLWINGFGMDVEEADAILNRPRNKRILVCSDHFMNGQKSLSYHDINYLPTVIRALMKPKPGKEDLPPMPSDQFVVKRLHCCPTSGWDYDEASDEVEHLAMILKKAWRDKNKDLAFVCRNGEKVMCHSIVMATASRILKPLLEEPTEGVKAISLADYGLDVVTEFVKSCYLVTDKTNYSNEMMCLLKILDVEELVHKVPSGCLSRTSARIQKKEYDKNKPIGTVSSIPVVTLRSHNPDSRGCKNCNTDFDFDSESPELLTCTPTPVPQPESIPNVEKKVKKEVGSFKLQVAKPGIFEQHSDDLTVHCVSCRIAIKTTYTSHNDLVNQLNARPDPKGKLRKVSYRCPNCASKPAQDKEQLLALGYIKKGQSGKVVAEDLTIGRIKKTKVPKPGGPESCLCPDCGEVFTSHTRLEYHMNLHKGIQPYSCSKCTFKSHSKHLVCLHKRSCDPRPKKDKCSKCDEPNTKRHMELHHNEDLEFKCTECEFRAANECAIRRHAARCHKDLGYENKLQCPKCPAMITENKMVLHESLHHDDSLPFACDECGFRALTQASVDNHKSKFHLKKPRIPCGGGCGMTFTQVPYMRWHMKRFCVNSTVKSEMAKREKERGLPEKRNQRKLRDIKKKKDLCQSVLGKPVNLN